MGFPAGYLLLLLSQRIQRFQHFDKGLGNGVVPRIGGGSHVSIHKQDIDLVAVMAGPKDCLVNRAFHGRKARQKIIEPDRIAPVIEMFIPIYLI